MTRNKFKVLFILAMLPTISVIAESPFAFPTSSSQAFPFLDETTQDTTTSTSGTGFEHSRIHSSVKGELDGNVYLAWMDDWMHSNSNSTGTRLAIVREFIHSVKNVRIKDDEELGLLMSGQDKNQRPAWCFQPYFLRILVKMEIEVYKILAAVFNDDSFKAKNLVPLDSYLTDYETSTLVALNKLALIYDSTGAMDTDADSDPFLYVATHPVLVYRMIRRFALDLQPLLHKIKHLDYRIIPSLWRHANPRQLVLPTKDDLDDALVSIVRIQESHFLETEKMAQGILGTEETSINMTAFGSLELGTFYLEFKMFDLAVQWLNEAVLEMEKTADSTGNPRIQEFFRFVLQSAIDEHNANLDRTKNGQLPYFVYTRRIETPFQPEMYTRRTKEMMAIAAQERNKTVWGNTMKLNFQRLCSGGNLQTKEERSGLKCWLERSTHKMWYINPIKTELLNEDPPILQMYDVLGDKLIDKLKRATASKLKRSTVVNYENGYESITASARTSSQAWLDEGELEYMYLKSLTKRYELLTGLRIGSVAASDQYQVGFYGSSHHFDPHLDAFSQSIGGYARARMTTILAYMSSVRVGGKTAFPALGTFAEPIKGSIIVWNNLKRNGERDERMYHGGCPVVLGVKWIIQKWIHYSPNMQTQCSLSQDQ